MIQALFALLSRLLPTKPAPRDPKRIVLILPCCIGDVVLATATLQALRRAYPQAYIAWAVGSWSKPVIEENFQLDAVIDTGDQALPVKSLAGMVRFVRQLRAGKFDLAVSLVRSPLMSIALLLTGIPNRAGLDSGGRGFGYTVRATIDPNLSRHEAEVYLDVARRLGIDTTGCRIFMPFGAVNRAEAREKRIERNIGQDYIVINPAGGRNPGMVMDVKRWPAANFAELANRFGLPVVLIGGKGDEALVEAVKERLNVPVWTFVGELSFGEISAMAHDAKLYIGNDTGLTHLAAASVAKTIMILGPSDPQRYAPFAQNALALWKPTVVPHGGVAAGAPQDWDWARDGISVDEAEAKIRTWLKD